MNNWKKDIVIAGTISVLLAAGFMHGLKQYIPNMLSKYLGRSSTNIQREETTRNKNYVLQTKKEISFQSLEDKVESSTQEIQKPAYVQEPPIKMRAYPFEKEYYYLEVQVYAPSTSLKPTPLIPQVKRIACFPEL